MAQIRYLIPPSQTEESPAAAEFQPETMSVTAKYRHLSGLQLISSKNKANEMTYDGFLTLELPHHDFL